MIRKSLVALLILPTMFSAKAAGESGQSVGALAARPLDARASAWRCELTAQFGCTTQGCTFQTPGTWVLLDFDRETYQRCDPKGCDAYPMTYFRSGLYTNINIGRSGGAIFKAINDGSEFVEVVTLGVTTLNGFGVCKPR